MNVFAHHVDARPRTFEQALYPHVAGLRACDAARDAVSPVAALRMVRSRVDLTQGAGMSISTRRNDILAPDHELLDKPVFGKLE